MYLYQHSFIHYKNSFFNLPTVTVFEHDFTCVIFSYTRIVFIFLEEGVTLDALLVLSREHINLLVPPIGDRALLEANIQGLKDGISKKVIVESYVSYYFINIDYSLISTWFIQRILVFFYYSLS